MIETKGSNQSTKDIRQINDQFNLVLKARNEKLAEVRSEGNDLDLKLPKAAKTQLV